MTWGGYIGAQFEHVVPVLALSRDRGVVPPTVEKPVCGLRWGKPARADVSSTNPSEDAQGGGFETITPPEYKQTTKVHKLAPVYREYDVLQVWSSTEPEDSVEIEHTTAVIFPMGQVTEKRISGATFVGGVVANVMFDDVRVKRFLRLEFNIPRPRRSDWLRSETEGEYPTDPEEQSFGW